MPGLVGFSGHNNYAGAKNLLAMMARALEPDDLFCVELFSHENVGLGRVSLGIFNPEKQPIWNEDKTLCIMMEGELYDYESLKRYLIERGHKFFVDNDAEFILHLYEEFGEDFPIKLNGAFIIAIWDRIMNKLVIVNDRLGLYPLYYSQQSGCLLFASGVRALLVDPSLSRKVDNVAIAEFLTFDHVLDDRTLLDKVKLLPQASILTFTDHTLQIKPYWTVRYPNAYPLCSEQEYMEEFLFRMRQAVNRQAHDDYPAGILLSGGLDSRILLAYLCGTANGNELYSFTWGIPGCDDARIAKEVSRRAGIRHHFFELKPDWVLEKADEAVRLTDGMGNIVNLHALATLEEETTFAKVIYKGFLGDAMMGYGLRHQFWANYDVQTTEQTHFQVHEDQGVITFNTEEQRRLFTDGFLNEIGSSVSESYVSGMQDARTQSLGDQRNYFDFNQRVPRMTIKGVEVVRSRAMVRLPFCDNDLVEFSLTVPPGLRYERRLVKNAFIKAFPELAQVPITETRYPMMECLRDVELRAKRAIRCKLRRLGLGRIIGPDFRPYGDYKNWFRTNLRTWVEDILLSQQAIERGYFDPMYIRTLIDDHRSGANHTVGIGALLSLELWHREFID